jgi:hypothetical protein
MARSILVHPGDANECLRIGAAQLTAEPIPPFPEETCLAMSHNVHLAAKRCRLHGSSALEKFALKAGTNPYRHFLYSDHMKNIGRYLKIREACPATLGE